MVSKRRVKFGGEKYQGAMPRKIGRAMKRAGIVPDGVPATYLGESPAPPEERVVDPEQEAEIAAVVESMPGNDLRQKAKDLRFLQLIAPGEGQLSIKAAWRKLHPTVSLKSATEAGSRRYREIRRAIGDQGVLALWGVHVSSIAKTLSEAQRAMFVRQFITRSGQVVTAPALVDHNIRLQAATIAMKMLGKGHAPEETARPVVVNLVQYNPPNFPKWPGGGRSDAPVAANMIPYTPPVALQAGTLGEPKDEG